LLTVTGIHASIINNKRFVIIRPKIIDSVHL
jgi:hypothetical protein